MQDFDDLKPKMSAEEREKLMQEFLSNGGKVKKLKPGIAKGAESMNKSKKLQWSEKEIVQQENNKHLIYDNE